MIGMPRNNVPRADEALLRELAAAYTKGSSIRELAIIKGWSYGAVHSRLQAAEQAGLCTIRPRGQWRRPSAQ